MTAPSYRVVPVSFDDERLASSRPWHVDLGWDGGQTAVVDINGHLVCDCEPREALHPDYLRGEAAANARLIVEAVNRYKAAT